MKTRTALLSFVLLGLATVSGIADEESTVRELISRFHKLQSELCSDSDRDDPLLFNRLDITKLSDDEKLGVKRIALKAISDWEKLAQREHPGLSTEQRKETLERLKRKAFDIDSRIEDSDVDAIIKYFEAHPSLDPRIMSLRFNDKDTIKITTGVVRGPLNGGGSFYVARRENGRWIVRSGGVWES